MVYRLWITDTQGRRICYLQTGDLHKAERMKEQITTKTDLVEAFIKVETGNAQSCT